MSDLDLAALLAADVAVAALDGWLSPGNTYYPMWNAVRDALTAERARAEKWEGPGGLLPVLRDIIGDPDWPSHGNPGLAISALITLWNDERERACARADAATAEVARLREVQSTLFEAIKHGDADHQTWLNGAIASHFAV